MVRVRCRRSARERRPSTSDRGADSVPRGDRSDGVAALGGVGQSSSAGAWSIQSNDTSGNRRTLASGTVAALGTGRWHTLSLTVNGNTLTATIDGTTVGRVT